MSAHTPYIVIPDSGFLMVTASLYQLKEPGDRPIYNKVANGAIGDMVRMANELNEVEARKHGELAVATTEDKFEGEVAVADGIPTPEPIPAEVRLDAVAVALSRADAGKINLVEFKRRVHAAVHSEDLIG